MGIDRQTSRSSGDFDGRSARLSQAGERGLSSPMSAKTLEVNKDRRTEFKPIGSIEIFDQSDFAAMREPRADELAEETHCFAVACRHGIKQDFAAEREFEVNAVLYLTPDGERVVEKHIRGLAGEYEAIPRVITAPTSMLERSAGIARRLAPAVRRHPEVGE